LDFFLRFFCEKIVVSDSKSLNRWTGQDYEKALSLLSAISFPALRTIFGFRDVAPRSTVFRPEQLPAGTMHS
jgi:hypothetical protein